jgi:Ca2+-binding EF-hand superfamily protein
MREVKTAVVELQCKRFAVDIDFGDPKVAAEYSGRLSIDRHHYLRTAPVDKKMLDAFDAADSDHSGGVDAGEIAELMSSYLKLSRHRREVQDRVAKVDKDGSGFLDFSEFSDFYGVLFNAECLAPCLQPYDQTGTGTVLRSDLPRLLLEQFQIASSGAEFDDLSPDDPILFVQIYRFLMNPDYNGVADDAVLNAPMDLNHPLAHYYIASSHNTYLEGDQLTGVSSVRAYQDAFDLCCRCVELDLWDGPDGVPLITHGHTLTSKVSAPDVLSCVAENQKPDGLPIVLSLENHLCEQQQDNLADIFGRYFGSQLADVAAFRNPDAMPSPNELRGKILLKSGVIDPGKDSPGKSRKLSDMIHLGTYQCPKNAGKWGTLEKPPWMMFSVSEEKIARFVSDESLLRSLQEHNALHLTRSYPKGSRVGSSNYDPVPGWIAGCQLVALNYQTASEPMRLNLALFKLNQGCGYVLKPSFIIDPEAAASPQGIKLHVTVIRGGGLPSQTQDVIDPYVQVRVVGWRTDTMDTKTRALCDNGLDPTWNETFSFPLLAPEIDFLVIALWDKDVTSDDLVASYTLPVRAIKPGFRAVPLYKANKHSDRIEGAFLLCNFRFGPI